MPAEQNNLLLMRRLKSIFSTKSILSADYIMQVIKAVIVMKQTEDTAIRKKIARFYAATIFNSIAIKKETSVAELIALGVQASRGALSQEITADHPEFAVFMTIEKSIFYCLRYANYYLTQLPSIRLPFSCPAEYFLYQKCLVDLNNTKLTILEIGKMKNAININIKNIQAKNPGRLKNNVKQSLHVFLMIFLLFLVIESLLQEFTGKNRSIFFLIGISFFSSFLFLIERSLRSSFILRSEISSLFSIEIFDYIPLSTPVTRSAERNRALPAQQHSVDTMQAETKVVVVSGNTTPFWDAAPQENDGFLARCRRQFSSSPVPVVPQLQGLARQELTRLTIQSFPEELRHLKHLPEEYLVQITGAGLNKESTYYGLWNIENVEFIDDPRQIQDPLQKLFAVFKEGRAVGPTGQGIVKLRGPAAEFFDCEVKMKSALARVLSRPPIRFEKDNKIYSLIVFAHYAEDGLHNQAALKAAETAQASRRLQP